MKLVHEILKHGLGAIRYLRYTGNGEPLLHPHACEMLKFAVDHAGVFVTLTTNGTLLNETIAHRLVEIGLPMIDVSIDALTQDAYSKIRINGDLRVTRANTLRLIRLAREGGARTRVVVSFVEQPKNHKEKDGFCRFWIEEGATDVVVRRLHSSAGALDKLAKRLWGVIAKRRRPCLYPWERLTLTTSGHLAYCPSDWLGGSELADYKSTTVRDVWRGQSMKRLRDAHRTNMFDSHDFCKQCPDWVLTRWPGEGRGYADLVCDLVRLAEVP